MALDLACPGLSSALDRLAPHLRLLIDVAAERALQLHSDRVGLTHVLGACIADENCAAHEAVSHAFADPETIEVELLALTPGLMVVGSKAVLAFSQGSIAALRTARSAALEAGDGELGVARVVAAGARALEAEVLDRLQEAGWREPDPGPVCAGPLSADGHLFQGMSELARQSLSQACRRAARAGDGSIGPAWLVLSGLELEHGLEERCGLSASRVRSLLGSSTRDAEPPPARAVSPDAGLLGMLDVLPEGADSLDLLCAAVERADAELQVLFQRHRLTTELLERARGAFTDPLA